MSRAVLPLLSDPAPPRPVCADPLECGPSPLPAPALHCLEHDVVSVRWSDGRLPLDNVYMLELRPRGGVWSPANIVSRVNLPTGAQAPAPYYIAI